MSTMAMKVGVILSATDKLSRVVNQATMKATKDIEQLKKTTAKISKPFNSVGKYVMGAGMATGAAIFTMAKHTATNAKEIGRASQRVNMNAESYQVYAKAAEQSGVEAEKFQASIAKMMKLQSAAAHGNKAAAKTFKELGISVYDANGNFKTSDRIISEVSEKFSKSNKNVLKADLAMKLFGRSGYKLLPMLNKGKKGVAELADEMRKEGNILNNDAIQKSAAFNKKLKEVAERLEGAKNKIAVSAMPAITQLADKVSVIAERFSGWIDKHKELIPQIITGAKWAVMIGGAIFGIGKSIQFVGTTAQAIMTVKKMLVTLNVVTKMAIINTKIFAAAQKIATAAQWLWNAAMTANPVGIVIVAIVALIAIVVVAWKKFAWFRSGIKTAWETVKGFGGILKDYVIDRIKSIISGLGSMGKAIGLLFKGKFSEAGKVAWAGVKDLSGYNVTQKAVQKSVALAKSVPATYNSIYKEEKAKEKKPQKQSAVMSVMNENTNNYSVHPTGRNAAPVINYTQNVNVTPGVNADELLRVLNQHKGEFSRFLDEVLKNKMRLAYAHQ